MRAKNPWIGTSWKMNKLRADALDFARVLAESSVSRRNDFHPFVIPPFPYIAEVAQMLIGAKVKIGAQNMHWSDKGAWTGEVSPLMVKDCGASMVEIGHSERRTHFGETDETVALKTQAALKHGLTALVCIGDTKSEFDAGKTAEALERQVRALLKYVANVASGKVLIAYEPVWSIGEGGVPATPEFANEQHSKIKALAKHLTGGALPILYGGSVNLENCAALVAQPQVDGLFIGRAAWEVQNYIKIINTVMESLK